jgi:hypothetical protein
LNRIIYLSQKAKSKGKGKGKGHGKRQQDGKVDGV